MKGFDSRCFSLQFSSSVPLGFGDAVILFLGVFLHIEGFFFYSNILENLFTLRLFFYFITSLKYFQAELVIFSVTWLGS